MNLINYIAFMTLGMAADCLSADTVNNKDFIKNIERQGDQQRSTDESMSTDDSEASLYENASILKFDANFCFNEVINKPNEEELHKLKQDGYVEVFDDMLNLESIVKSPTLATIQSENERLRSVRYFAAFDENLKISALFKNPEQNTIQLLTQRGYVDVYDATLSLCKFFFQPTDNTVQQLNQRGYVDVYDATLSLCKFFFQPTQNTVQQLNQRGYVDAYDENLLLRWFFLLSTQNTVHQLNQIGYADVAGKNQNIFLRNPQPDAIRLFIEAGFGYIFYEIFKVAKFFPMLTAGDSYSRASRECPFFQEQLCPNISMTQSFAILLDENRIWELPWEDMFIDQELKDNRPQPEQNLGIQTGNLVAENNNDDNAEEESQMIQELIVVEVQRDIDRNQLQQSVEIKKHKNTKKAKKARVINRNKGQKPNAINNKRPKITNKDDENN